IVYVVGAVGKPGSFILQDPQSGITVLQAIAMAEGLNGVAAANRSLVIRHPPGQQRELIPIDVGRLMKGKSEDRELQANDILFVPESQSKKTMQALARTAEQSVAEISGYGLGLRVAGTK
ncbi:MAG: hypothetical protein JO061_06800, partial [Acidobacteriaceae bacterium]|nr:hypothetical protein [Acidobacteriaceae bacterium]